MHSPRYSTIAFVVIVLLLNACTSSTLLQDSKEQVNTVYCDSYLAYDMCAEDLNGDGTVDILFFEDTYETIMYWEPTQHLIPENKPMHKCVQIMDKPMKKSNTETLYVDESTDLIVVSNIKTRIFLSFSRYWSDVNACNGVTEEDDFGSDFPDEF